MSLYLQELGLFVSILTEGIFHLHFPLLIHFFPFHLWNPFFPLLWHFTSFYRDFLCFYHLFLSFYWFIDLFLFILRGVFIYYSLFYTVIIKSFHICTDACSVWQRQEVNSSSSAGMWWSVTVVQTAASRCFILIRQMGVRTKAAIVCPLNKRKYCLEFSRKMNLVFWSSLFFVI